MNWLFSKIFWWRKKKEEVKEEYVPFITENKKYGKLTEEQRNSTKVKKRQLIDQEWYPKTKKQRIIFALLILFLIYFLASLFDFMLSMHYGYMPDYLLDTEYAERLAEDTRIETYAYYVSFFFVLSIIWIPSIFYWSWFDAYMESHMGSLTILFNLSWDEHWEGWDCIQVEPYDKSKVTGNILDFIWYWSSIFTQWLVDEEEHNENMQGQLDAIRTINNEDLLFVEEEMDAANEDEGVFDDLYTSDEHDIEIEDPETVQNISKRFTQHEDEWNMNEIMLEVQDEFTAETKLEEAIIIGKLKALKEKNKSLSKRQHVVIPFSYYFYDMRRRHFLPKFYLQIETFYLNLANPGKPERHLLKLTKKAKRMFFLREKLALWFRHDEEPTLTVMNTIKFYEWTSRVLQRLRLKRLYRFFFKIFKYNLYFTILTFVLTANFFYSFFIQYFYIFFRRQLYKKIKCIGPYSLYNPFWNINFLNNKFFVIPKELLEKLNEEGSTGADYWEIMKYPFSLFKKDPEFYSKKINKQWKNIKKIIYKKKWSKKKKKLWTILLFKK